MGLYDDPISFSLTPEEAALIERQRHIKRGGGRQDMARWLACFYDPKTNLMTMEREEYDEVARYAYRWGSSYAEPFVVIVKAGERAGYTPSPVERKQPSEKVVRLESPDTLFNYLQEEVISSPPIVSSPPPISSPTRDLQTPRQHWWDRLSNWWRPK